MRCGKWECASSIALWANLSLVNLHASFFNSMMAWMNRSIVISSPERCSVQGRIKWLMLYYGFVKTNVDNNVKGDILWNCQN